MELKPNMYVRSKINGIIGKITDIENIEVSNGTEVIRAGIRYILDNNYNRGFCDTEKDSVIASHNIIDLIEVGDYVDGVEINYKDEQGVYHGANDAWDEVHFTDPKHIHNIVTKEQFESMSYKVGE